VCGNQLLNKHGVSLRRSAAEVECAVATVRPYLPFKAAPKYKRKVKRLTKLARYDCYLRERQTAAQPNWIPASVWHGEIVDGGYHGVTRGHALLRLTLPFEPVDSAACRAGFVRQHEDGHHRARCVRRRPALLPRWLPQLRQGRRLPFQTVPAVRRYDQRQGRAL
jgi:hypothetical protein